MTRISRHVFGNHREKKTLSCEYFAFQVGASCADGEISAEPSGSFKPWEKVEQGGNRTRVNQDEEGEKASANAGKGEEAGMTLTEVREEAESKCD